LSADCCQVCGGGEAKGKKKGKDGPHACEHMGYYPAKEGKEPKERSLPCQVCWKGGGPMNDGVAVGNNALPSKDGCKTCGKHMHKECFKYWPDHKHLP